LLCSQDFGEWEELVASSLGHHRSRLLPGSLPFEAQIRAGGVDEFQVLWLQGTGQLELQREQCGHGVLWLPLQGLSHETINGEEQLAEPSMGLLFRPGDVMRVRWVPFIGQFWPLTSLTPGGRNRVRSQCRPHREFCLPESCVALHGSTSIGTGPG
jgi:hypothetical protein